MSDLIKREYAVKTVIRKCSPICAWQVGTQQYPDCVVAEINALPSANDNWIPVSERLPEQTGEYLVSVHYDRDCVWTDKFGYTPTTDGGWYDPEDTKQNMVDWNKYITAWMPLPTPYKGGDDE